MLTQIPLRPPAWAAAFAVTTALALPAAAQTVTLKDKLETNAQSSKEAEQRTSAERALNDAIRDFYAKREFKSLWFESGAMAPRTKALLSVLAKADEHGLNPSTYGMPKLGERAARADAKQREELEVELTLAYLGYAGDVISGTVSNPRRVGGTFRDAKRPDPQKLLEDLAAAQDPAKFLDNLPPDTRRYKNLLAALHKYRELEKKGGWPTVAAGPTLKPGMKHPRVA